MRSLLQSYQQFSEAPLPEAQSLPFAVYHDKTVYETEAQQVFREDWVFACAEQQLPNAGDYFAFDLVGEAVVIIRGADGQCRALSNICRHRGTPLLDEGFGNVERHIICPYHAWSYKDTGELKAVPYPGEIKVDKQAHCLPRFHLQTWMGLLFINLSANPYPLVERMEGIDSYLSVFKPERFTQGYTGGTEHWQANWKLVMENAMESYHLFKVHKETLETVTPSKQAYYIAGSSEWSLTGGKMVDTRSRLEKWLMGDGPEAYNHYVLVSLPPSFVGIMTYESFDWIQILPDGPEGSIIRSAGIAESSGQYDDRLMQEFVEAFFAEDKWICERVQKGMHSRLGSGGKLVGMEKILVDFRQFLASRLFGSDVDAFSETTEAERFLRSD